MAPPRAKAGDPVSASTLNYCIDGVSAFETQERGVQERGKHNLSVPDKPSCNFPVKVTEAIPSFGIFCIKEPLAGTYPGDRPFVLSEKPSDLNKTGLYTNGARPAAVDNFILVDWLEPWQKFKLLLQATCVNQSQERILSKKEEQAFFV